jgi:hypothetical protein
MKLVRVSNTRTGKEYFHLFETEKECENWIERNIKKGTWGSKEQLVIEIEDSADRFEVEESYRKLRQERDGILKSLDYTQLPDAPFSSEERRYFREYRQYLRDLPTKHYNDTSVHNYKIMNFVEFKWWKHKVK